MTAQTQVDFIHISSMCERKTQWEPIRIAANPSPFNHTEAHFIATALYNELSAEESSIIKPSGTPLPDWEDIKDYLDVDL